MLVNASPDINLVQIGSGLYPSLLKCSYHFSPFSVLPISFQGYVLTAIDLDYFSVALSLFNPNPNGWGSTGFPLYRENRENGEK